MMSDVLSRILAEALRGAGGGRGGAGPGMSGGQAASPLGEPRLPGAGPAAGSGGGIGDILGGLLGGLAGGGMGGQATNRGAAPEQGGLGGLLGGLGGMKGAALMALLAYLMQGRGGTAGLASLTNQLRSAGLGDEVDSWVGPGANRNIRPDELARAIPREAMEDIERQTGLGRDEVLSELSRGLPGMVDRLTPQGRMPERDEELNDIDERDVFGGFVSGATPGAAYGKFAPGQSGGRKD